MRDHLSRALLLAAGSLFTVVATAAGTGRDAQEYGNRVADERIVTIHYHRFDGDYDEAGIWTWDEGLTRAPEPNEIFPVGRDDFGLIFKLDPSLYGRPGDRIGLLPRLHKDWNFKDNGDRYWSPDMGDEIYLVEGRSDVYASPPDVAPRLIGATLDDLDAITIRFTHAMRPPSAEQITVRDDGGHALPVAGVAAVEASAAGTSRSYSVRMKRALDFSHHRYEVEVQGFERRPVQLGRVLANERFYDPAALLGATYTPDATTFRVFSPMADAAEVVLSSVRTGGAENAHHSMTRNEHGVWSVAVNGDWKGRFYAYKLTGSGLQPDREVVDIYATCAQGLDARARIVDPDATDPPGFDPSKFVTLTSYTDAVIYEMHVRDFSIAAHSGITHKGKYLGLAESGTRLPGHDDVRTGLDHLSELGVTHVHLLPVQDFENNEASDTYNWGYMTAYFNTPEGLYATTPDGPARIRELKQAIQAFHDRGIGVVLDVVYNHASPRSSFELLAPGYYFRMKPDGTFWNGSGCGNEVASEMPMTRKFILDSLAYWVTVYGIDGFRFDLMGLMDLETMEAIRDHLRPLNPSVLLYGEPWTGGPSGLARVTDKSVIRGTGIAAFNDDFRDAIKGDRDGGAPGFIQTGDRIDRVRQGIAGAIHGWATNPTDAITYCAAHDNLTTWDKIVQAAPDATDEVKKRMQRFAGLLVLTSQGTPFLHAGQEFCRSKGGNHNSYNAPDAVNRIDWSLKKTNRDVFDYYRGLIALRKSHPAFRLRTRDDVLRRLQFLDKPPSARCLAYTLDGRRLPGETWSSILVLLNGDPSDQTFALPPGTWHVLADADRAGTAALRDESEGVRVLAHSGVVLCK